MTIATSSIPVDIRSDLPLKEFCADYMHKKPVLIRGLIAGLPAVRRWTIERLGAMAPDVCVQLKTGDVAEGATTTTRLAEFCRAVTEWEHAKAEPGPPAYLHDVPLLAMIPGLRKELEPLQGTAFLPRFYRRQWWSFAQFFVGPSSAQTPLHFDTLLTHNLFFQIHGRKRWVMVDAADRELAYPRQWRWSPVDPEAPDLGEYPKFADARLMSCVLEGGDVLYLPPGTLHKVVSETDCISFNLDWHDRLSALRGIAAVRQGMPRRNLRYNVLMGLGVWAQVPAPWLMPGLRSYFSYVS